MFSLSHRTFYGLGLSVVAQRVVADNTKAMLAKVEVVAVGAVREREARLTRGTQLAATRWIFNPSRTSIGHEGIYGLQRKGGR